MREDIEKLAKIFDAIWLREGDLTIAAALDAVEEWLPKNEPAREAKEECEPQKDECKCLFKCTCGKRCQDQKQESTLEACEMYISNGKRHCLPLCDICSKYWDCKRKQKCEERCGTCKLIRCYAVAKTVGKPCDCECHKHEYLSETHTVDGTPDMSYVTESPFRKQECDCWGTTHTICQDCWERRDKCKGCGHGCKCKQEEPEREGYTKSEIDKRAKEWNDEEKAFRKDILTFLEEYMNINHETKRKWNGIEELRKKYLPKGL